MARHFSRGGVNDISNEYFVLVEGVRSHWAQVAH